MLSLFLSILFLILKIIGIILLVILFLILLILLVPIRYRFEMCYTKEKPVYFLGSLNWFIFLVRGEIKYSDSNLSYYLRILKKTLLSNMESEEDVSSENTEADDGVFEEISEYDPVETEKEAELPMETSEETEEKKEVPEESFEETKEEKEAPEETSEETEKKAEVTEVKSKETDKEEDVSEDKSSKNPLSGVTERISHLMKRIDDTKDKAEEYQVFYLIEIGKDALIRIVRHLLPVRIKGFLHYGFEDPSYTGRLTAFLATVYPYYGNSFSICPDFQTACFEGDCSGKGRIRLGFLLIIVISLLMKKEVRKLIGLLLK